jgi:hypothetical protein
MRAIAMQKEVTQEFLQFACGQAVNHAPVALNCELSKHTDYEFGHVPLRAGFRVQVNPEAQQNCREFGLWIFQSERAKSRTVVSVFC